MKLSARGRYAVRLMVELLRNGAKEKPVQLSEIARITGISRTFLEQLAIALKNHALLRGICGRKGGYVLARPAEEITLRQIIVAAVGPISLAVCVEDSLLCMRSDFCTCRLIWSLLQARIDGVLNEYSLADLVDDKALQAMRQELETAQAANPNDAERTAGSAAAAPACAQVPE